MDDLISRQDALKALDEMSYKSPHESAISVVRKKHFGEILEKFIMQQPSAQPERKTGRLIHESAYNWFRCNVCRKIYPSEFLQYFDSCQYQPRFNFCPNCGADMRGENDG